MRLSCKGTRRFDHVLNLRHFLLTLNFSNAVHFLSIFVSETLTADHTDTPNLDAMTAVLIWMRTTREKQS